MLDRVEKVSQFFWAQFVEIIHLKNDFQDVGSVLRGGKLKGKK